MSINTKYKWSRLVQILAWLVAITSLVSLLSISYLLKRDQEKNLFNAQSDALNHAKQISNEISDQLDIIRPLVTSMVEELNNISLSKDQLRTKLEKLFHDNHGAYILEVGVAFVADTEAQQSAPHFGLKNGGPDHFQVEDSYDYIESEWYKNAMKKGSHWIHPYYGQATKAWTAGYAMRFYQGAEKNIPAGVARINFRLDKVRQLVSSHRVGRTGFAFLYTDDKIIMTHPIEDYIGKTIDQVESGDAVLNAVNKSHDFSKGHVVNDQLTGQTYWVYSVPFKSSEWNVGVVFNEREAMRIGNDLSKYWGAINLSLVMLALSAVLLASRAYSGTEGALWFFSVFASVIFILGICATWYLHLDNPYISNNKDIRVVDRTATEVILENFRSDNEQLPDIDPVRIPTGLFIQSLRFTSANNVVLTGYVWQRCLSIDCVPNNLPGVIFPEAESDSITDAFTSDKVKGWYFETTLRQQFSYLHYPFDREDVWIRLWPNDFRHFQGRVILVPDFMGYQIQSAEFRPGLENDFVMEGWEFINSYFSYRQNSYNVNFGLETMGNVNKTMELYFNIGMERNFVSPFVSDMIPIIVVSFLVFSVLMITTRDAINNQLFGFSASSVLGYCAALFFVVIIAHVNLRRTLAAQGIIYLEYFYFLMYLAILVTSTNALLFSSKVHISIIDYKDNLILKLLYWPALAGGAFVITRFVF